MRAERDPTAAEWAAGMIEVAARGEPKGDNCKIHSLSSQEREGRDAVRAGIREAEITGLSGSTLLATLLSETLPRLVNAYGPANASLILTRIARDIRTGAAPNTTRQ